MSNITASTDLEIEMLIKILNFCKENSITLGFNDFNLEFNNDEFRITKDDKQTINIEDGNNETYSVNSFSEVWIDLRHTDMEISETPDIERLYSYILEVEEGELIETSVLYTPLCSYFYIEGDVFALDSFPKESITIDQKWNGFEISVEIVSGLTSFGLKLIQKALYDEYFSPIDHNDFFVKIQTDKSLSLEEYHKIFNAYIFELSSSYNVNFKSTYKMVEYIPDWNERVDELTNTTITPRLRPLISGKGMHQLLSLYNEANSIQNHEYRILTYAKVIEYVSQTVLRKEMLTAALSKLFSSRVLSPDATYILELERLFEEHRANKKDSQAIKLTVQTCCDLFELIDIAPEFLKKIKGLKSENATLEQIRTCLDEISNAITDTRNMIAHAKTNYKPKGNECPYEDLDKFAEILKIIANQAIRWFSIQHEDNRII